MADRETSAAETSQAAARLSEAASTVPAFAAWLRTKLATKACAGGATTNRKAAINSMSSPANRLQSAGMAAQTTMTVSSAVMGVG